MEKYVLRILIAFDQLINTIGGGYPNETLSARAWRKGDIEGNRAWQTLRHVIDAIFEPLHYNHCEESYIHCRKVHKSCGVYLPVFCSECKSPKYSRSPEEELDQWLNYLARRLET